MKLTIAAAMSLLAASAAIAQGGWKNPQYVTATISEKFEQTQPRELTVTKKGDSFSYLTSNEIDGMLGGVQRMEVAGPNGFYTWIPSRPDLVLRLWNPTSPDVFDMLAKPKFSRADLEVYVEGIEKALGKKVLVGKSEKIAERDCLVLTILDQPGSSTDYQRLWIDRETGLAMKLVDVVRGNTEYEREVKSISFATPGPEVLFAPKEGAKVLSGIVLPTTLVNSANLASVGQLSTDIAAVNQKSGINWAGAVNELPGYGYAGSNFRQIRRDRFQVGQERVDPREAERQRRRQQRGNQIAERARFVSSNGGGEQTFEIRIATMEGMATTTGGDVMITTALPPTIGADGRIVEGRSGTGTDDKTTVYPMVQSDFVDAKTGDTVTLLQIDKRDLKPWLLQLGLDEGVAVAHDGVGNGRFHVAQGPMKLNVLTWQVGQARMALVATRLGKDELAEIASKIQPGR